MKYKKIGLAVILFSLVFAFIAQGIEPPKKRYHQHLEAAEKAVCTDHGADTFCTHLPLFQITTDAEIPDPYYRDENGEIQRGGNGRSVKNNEMVSASVEYFDSKTKNNHLSDKPTVAEKAMIRVRGASSRGFDKKGYLLKFVEEDLVTGKDVSLSGMTADNSWVLHGPFLDKTLIRNYLCYNLSGEIMDYAPNVRFCEVVLNGEYMGLYLLVEKINQNDNGRINITKSDPDLATTSYIVRADRGAIDAEYELNTFGAYAYMTIHQGNKAGQMEIVYPGKYLTKEQHDYIQEDLSRFEKALFSYDYNNEDKGYRQYIDVDSFVDFFLINEFTLNYDAPVLSTYLYKDIGGRLKMCVWDFNSAFDYYEYSVVTPETFVMHDSMWFRYLFKDETFVDQTIQRYHELREKFFNEEYLLNYIDETIAYLGPAIDRNFEKWGYSFNSTYEGVSYDYLVPAERNVRSYDAAVAQLKNCIIERIQHMDNNLDRLYSLCHESLNKEFNYDRKTGRFG